MKYDLFSKLLLEWVLNMCEKNLKEQIFRKNAATNYANVYFII